VAKEVIAKMAMCQIHHVACKCGRLLVQGTNVQAIQGDPASIQHHAFTLFHVLPALVFCKSVFPLAVSCESVTMGHCKADVLAFQLIHS